MTATAEPLPLKECPEAAADARELARRAGAHRPSEAQAAVVLHGSRANGTHREDPDPDMPLALLASASLPKFIPFISPDKAFRPDF